MKFKTNDNVSLIINNTTLYKGRVINYDKYGMLWIELKNNPNLDKVGITIYNQDFVVKNIMEIE